MYRLISIQNTEMHVGTRRNVSFPCHPHRQLPTCDISSGQSGRLPQGFGDQMIHGEKTAYLDKSKFRIDVGQVRQLFFPAL